MESAVCHRCRRDLAGRMVFALKTAAGETSRCLRCALRYLPMLKRSVIAALVVGSILTALNHGDVLFAGDWSSAFYWKIPLTYLTPCVVATWGALANARR